MSGDRWGRVEVAFLAHGYDDRNLPFVRRIVEAVGIDHFERTSSRAIRAVRSDGGRRLLIKPGYTVGFVSEEEILGTVGDVERWRNNSREWGVTHPINSLR